jgi:7-keto-8-aminopelargonate synthetase-like enzyme
MRKKFYKDVFSILQSAAKLSLGHLTTDDKGFTSSTVNIKGKSYVNFALCDYLALGHDERIKQGAIHAIQDHGFYASISKTYIKLNIYETAEQYLKKVFGNPAVLFPRTTLAHIGILPVVTDTNDAIILDQQVHTSVRIAADLLRSYGNYVETIKHNRIDILEARINELMNKYNNIWYLADSVYSMFGDTMPCKEIEQLLHKYERFYLYVDDSHGLSWNGENGRGFILNHISFHPHLIISTSLCKGFGAEGGATICHGEEMFKRLMTCSAPLIFVSPISPATLGAIIESSKIHLSAEIYKRQVDLKAKITLFKETAQNIDLPLVDNSDTPIFFVPTNKIDIGNEICSNFIRRGYYACMSPYPAVPLNNSGIRMQISLYLSDEEIVKGAQTLKEEYDKVLKRRNLKTEDILKFYRKEKVMVY